jgi:hypothetical protein
MAGGRVGFSVAAYLSYAGTAWFRYGHARQPASSDETDPLLDRFMPAYEVAERHHIRVAAPAAITFSAATDLDLTQSAGILAHPRELLAQMKASGTLKDGRSEGV